MSLTKLAAWELFRTAALEGKEPRDLTEDEADAYAEYKEAFGVYLAQIGVAANNEAVELTKDMDEALKAKPRVQWDAQDYYQILNAFGGSRYEKLHLTAFFNVRNNVLLLDLIKPTA